MEIRNQSDYYVTGILISSIAIFFVTTLIGVCCKKKKDVTKPTTTTISKDSRCTQSQQAKDYPRAAPIKNIPIAPAREDDDTLKGVQSLKKDEHSMK